MDFLDFLLRSSQLIILDKARKIFRNGENKTKNI